MSGVPKDSTRDSTADVATADVTAVIVNYNSGERLARLLERLQGEVAGIVVVDNASTDGSADAGDLANIRLFRNSTNRGFAVAANIGAAYADAKWILFLNPDTHPEPGAIRTLSSHAPVDVTVIAPAQVDETGEALSETGGHDPSLARYAAWAIMPGRLLRDRGPWLCPPFPMADFFPDWVSGAFMLARRDAFDRVHGFDERFFLYQEDADLCRRMRTAGYRVMCRAWVRVHHEVGQGDRKRKAEANSLSVAPLAARFEGWRRRALGLILIVGYGCRALRPGRGRAARAALPQVLKLLRSG